MIPSRVTLALVGIQIPWMLMRSILFRVAREKGHRVRVMGVVSAVEHMFNETAMHARTPASTRLAKANRASHGQRVRAKIRVKRTRANPKAKSKEPINGAEGSLKGKTSKTWNDGWNCDEWNDGWSFGEWSDEWIYVGWHEGWEQTYDISAS